MRDSVIQPLGEHLKDKKILLLSTGSIAAYKTPSLARHFRQYGADVEVYLTPETKRYVTEEALEWASDNPVVSELTANSEHLRSDVDAYVVAPATYNTIGKFANGVADNAVTATLASATGRMDDGASIFVAPAMHGSMYNSTCKENIEKLKSKGVKIIEPDYKQGKANLTSTHNIVVETIRGLSESPLKNKSIIINAGPTMGKIDNVRGITNIFRGRTGIDIADEAYMRGAKVKLIYASGGLKVPDYIDTTKVRYFEEMYDEVMKEVENYDIGIFSAAIVDYVPEDVFDGKIKSKGAVKEIKLKQTPKIINEVRKKCPEMYMVTFKLENNIDMEHLFKIGRNRLSDGYQTVIVNRLEDMDKHTHLSHIMNKDGKMYQT
ncbi:MAG: bifunctional phosphopantothenoylcysteine decarboxylase/phosphopantothenate--cysteine ligase CoaBC, partial [archaeon]